MNITRLLTACGSCKQVHKEIRKRLRTSSVMKRFVALILLTVLFLGLANSVSFCCCLHDFSPSHTVSFQKVDGDKCSCTSIGEKTSFWRFQSCLEKSFFVFFKQAILQNLNVVGKVFFLFFKFFSSRFPLFLETRAPPL
jgi:hypothetical protein